jgi:hypothetical protein
MPVADHAVKVCWGAGAKQGGIHGLYYRKKTGLTNVKERLMKI